MALLEDSTSFGCPVLDLLDLVLIEVQSLSETNGLFREFTDDLLRIARLLNILCSYKKPATRIAFVEVFFFLQKLHKYITDLENHEAEDETEDQNSPSKTEEQNSPGESEEHKSAIDSEEHNSAIDSEEQNYSSSENEVFIEEQKPLSESESERKEEVQYIPDEEFEELRKLRQKCLTDLNILMTILIFKQVSEDGRSDPAQWNKKSESTVDGEGELLNFVNGNSSLLQLLPSLVEEANLLDKNETEARQAWKSWTSCREKTIIELKLLADKMDEHSKNEKIAVVSGGVAGIIGTGLAVAGFGLSFFTMGATLPLAVAGAAIGVAGGGTSIGASIADHYLEKGLLNSANEAIQEDQRNLKAMNEKVKAFMDALKKYKEKSVTQYPSILGPVDLGIEVGSILVRSPGVGMALSAAAEGARVLRVAENAGAVTFRTLSGGAKALHIAGVALSIATLPFDIYLVVKNSIAIHKQEGSPAGQKVRDLAEKIISPKDVDFDGLIDRLIWNICSKELSCTEKKANTDDMDATDKLIMELSGLSTIPAETARQEKS